MEYTGIWKYCTKEYIKDMMLSFHLLEGPDWTEERIMSCLYALSNHPENYYHEVRIPKKKGGKRILFVPDPLLKHVQRNILHHILEGMEVSEAATAYKKGSRTADNGKFHVGRKMVLKLDIQDFFGSIIFPMVLHHAFPGKYFPTPAAVMLTHLCCLRECLPQGAPTSPAVSNLVMKPFDETMLQWCRERGIQYTRYCDDMTFSGDFDEKEVIKKVSGFLHAMGMELNHGKTSLCRNGMRQMVTGVVVNEKVQVPVSYRRKLRQEIYYFKKFGWEEAETDRERQRNILLGKVNYVLSVNPSDGWFQTAGQELKALAPKK